MGFRRGSSKVSTMLVSSIRRCGRLLPSLASPSRGRVLGFPGCLPHFPYPGISRRFSSSGSLSPSTQGMSRFVPVPGRDEGPRPVSGVSSEDAGLSGGLLPFLGSSLPGVLLVLPVALGAGLAPGPVRYRGVRAVAAEAQFLSLLPSLLLVATAIGRPVWVLASELFVPLTILLGGILLSGASRRIPCCCSAASEGFLRASGGLLYFLAGAG